MPEYLAPGVFVEEVSFRSKSIEGVSTTTTGVIGPTRYGPLAAEPEVITSLVEFERTYGDGQQLLFHVDNTAHTPQPAMHNYVWHAARTFFEQGGKRLYVQRVFDRGTNLTMADCTASVRIEETVATGATSTRRLIVRARHPGDAGARTIRITLTRGPNLAAVETGGQPARLNGLQHLDVVRVEPTATAADAFWALAMLTTLPNGDLAWRFQRQGSATPFVLPNGVVDATTGATFPRVRVVTATVEVAQPASGLESHVRSGLALEPNHRLGSVPDSITATYPATPALMPSENSSPVTIAAELDAGTATGLDVLATLLRADEAGTPTARETSLLTQDSPDAARTVSRLLSGGSDGIRPTSSAYKGTNAAALGVTAADRHLAGFGGLESIEDISIVAAPGSTFGGSGQGWRQEAATITQDLIGHVEKMRYRIAVLDPPEALTTGQVQAWRGTIDSRHAALYFPWVRILDPITRTEIHLPPCGFVAGIYARNDVTRAVFKAPANEVVTGALGFETLLNTGQQEVLNPLGVNCFRFFEGRGFRLWGARTISSDPEWKYVNLRRYFAYLERSIDLGTQWAVFEVNGTRLWANVRQTILDFLFNEWVMGAMLGDRPETSYFVKCDRSTMSQNDLDNGRLVCLIGVAAVRPAEFVIFRVGQWTADRKS